MVVTIQERLDSEVAKLGEKIQQLLDEQTKQKMEQAIAITTAVKE
jgi:hypothetical protein